jgi:hypothetical protein
MQFAAGFLALIFHSIFSIRTSKISHSRLGLVQVQAALSLQQFIIMKVSKPEGQKKKKNYKNLKNAQL